MISKILSIIDKQKITMGGWLAGFAGIVFIRFILENFSSPSALGFLVSDPDTLVQYAFFFLLSALGLATILYFFDNKNKNAIKYALFLIMIIWLGPIIDIIVSSGKGSFMVYIADSHKKLFFDFIRFWSVEKVTLGIKIESFLLLFAIGLFIWEKTKNKIKTILTPLITYTFLFIIGALPGVIFTITNPFDKVTNTPDYLEKLIVNSNFMHNSYHPATIPISYYRFLEIGFDKLISQIFFIAVLILAFLWFWNTNKEKTKNILKNSRPERLTFYYSLILLGIGYSMMTGLGKFYSWVDYLSLIVLFLSWYGASMFAIHTNDIADIEIDKISNKNRPLIQKTLSVDDMRNTQIIWLMISIIGSFLVSPYVLFFNLTATSAYYIYSTTFLRLKRVPFLSLFLIAIACVSSILAGFFFLSESKNITLLNPSIILGMIIIFTLFASFKDLKDIEGDKADGIKTIPTMFGKYGKQITAILFATSFLFLPIVLSFYTLYILAIPASIFGYKIVMRKKYKEKYIFILYFVFCISTALLITFLEYFAKNMAI